MRVAYVGNFRPSWSTENHVAGSLRALGHEVVEFQEDEQPDQLDTLAQRVIDSGASMMLYTKTWGLDPDVTLDQWAQLDAAGVPTVSYHLDLYVGLDREEQLDREPFWRTRYVFSADGGHDDVFAAHGIDHEWLRPGVFKAECVPGRRDARHRRLRVAFVGSHRAYHAEWPYRVQLVQWLRTTYRGQFGAFPQGHHAIRGQQLNDLYASVPVFVGDSLCPGFDQPYYWSDRVYETLGRGGFLIHPRIVGMEDEFVDGEHLRFYTFGDFDELRTLIDYYSTHVDEARAIAERGQQFVRDHCTYEERVSEMIDRLRAKGALSEMTAHTSNGPVQRMRASLGRYSAIFEPRDDTTDVSVIEEVWRSNDYGIDGQVRGTVVDVGANIGAFSVLAAKSGAHRVVAVEPHPRNRERLVHHLQLNDVADVVTVVEAAIVGQVESATVSMVGDGGGAHVTGQGDGVFDVWSMTLDTLIADNAPITLLKMDIEGGEYDAFEGLDVARLASVDRIVMEFHGPAMPHLTWLDDPDNLEPFLPKWGALVAKLADAGRVRTFGHPSRGGLIDWTRY